MIQTIKQSQDKRQGMGTSSDYGEGAMFLIVRIHPRSGDVSRLPASSNEKGDSESLGPRKKLKKMRIYSCINVGMQNFTKNAYRNK
jgi:hypothetical protein